MSVTEIPLVSRLKGPALIEAGIRQELETDYKKTQDGWWPTELGTYLLERYQVDVTARYAGMAITNPFGKASGQLTMNFGQIQEAQQAGLGFVVLKTVIAQDSSGHQSMSAWAIPEAKMVVETIKGQSGREGWTVTWKGRGWSRTFSEYIRLCDDCFGLMAKTGMVVAPSVKFHLPSNMHEDWRKGEYEYVLGALQAAWQRAGLKEPLVLEKDFSPTLAGDERGQQLKLIERWLTEVVGVIRESTNDPVKIGIKLFNFMGNLEEQSEIFRQAILAKGSPDFLVYANRLFDPEKEFEGQRGVAYGGPDLSDRNLWMLGNMKYEVAAQGLEISGTGDIDCGRTALEYGLKGCSSVQMHTVFQTPYQSYMAASTGRVRRTLARLMFHPEDGLVAWMLHARQIWGMVDSKGVTKWLDLSSFEEPEI